MKEEWQKQTNHTVIDSAQVRVAVMADVNAIHNLLKQALRQQVHFDSEEIETAIELGRFLLLVRDRADEDIDTAEELLGCLVTAVEMDAAPFSASQPIRWYVNGVAFARQVSPTTALQQLLRAFVQSADRSESQQLIAYSNERWLDRALRSADMTLAERVDYFALERLQTRSWPAPTMGATCTIRDATHNDLEPLLALDSRAFDVLWRYTWRQMRDAWVSGPLLVAWIGDALVAYSALTVEAESCTIARLAVDPAWQGHGLGSALLAAGLQIAQEAGCSRALLNTQTTNHRAQQIYRRFGFRPTGESFSVFVLDLPAIDERRKLDASP